MSETQATPAPAFRFQERFYEMLKAEERAGSAKCIGTMDGHDLLKADE